MLLLLTILDDWTSQLDVGKQIDVIYTDFEKAFDLIKFPTMHQLVNCLHIDSMTLIQCLQDFLCSRKQRVRINGFFSQ